VAAVALALERPNVTLFAAACERYGVDPAGAFDDDFLAAQFRVGVAVRATREAEKAAEPDPFTAAREAGRKVREAT
jgi:hypothetical protein